jgi:hypothetical protein
VSYTQNVYSGFQNVVYYSSDTYVDILGSAGGNRLIRRYKMSDWSYTDYAGGSICYYYYGGGLYSGYYYFTGSYYPSPPTQNWAKPLWKIQQSNLNLIYTKSIDDKAGTIYEDNRSATVDGPNNSVYLTGLSYTGPGNNDPPIVGTLSKYDLDGNYQWHITSLGSNIYCASNCGLTHYGDYLINTEYSGAGTGYLRLRNKSDGQIAELGAKSHFYPVHFRL